MAVSRGKCSNVKEKVYRVFPCQVRFAIKVQHMPVEDSKVWVVLLSSIIKFIIWMKVFYWDLNTFIIKRTSKLLIKGKQNKL